MRVQPIILAAGKGTRMGNPDRPKVLTPLLGKPVLQYLLDTLAAGNFLPPALVVGFHQEQVREAFGDAYTYIVQDKQLGTGHAVAVCQEALKGKVDVFVVINGDMPLVKWSTLEQLVMNHQETDAVMSIMTGSGEHPSFMQFGHILRGGDGHVLGIREYKDCSAEEKLIQEVNIGEYAFSGDWLWEALAKVNSNNAQGEYYITDLLGIAVEEGRRVSTLGLSQWQEGLGINTPEQLAEVEEVLKKR